MTFHVDVVSPEKIVISSDIEEVTVPTTTGDITILPHHIPLLSQIRPGELILRSREKQDLYAITGGFVEVGKKGVTILAEYAVHSDAIDAVKAEEAKKRAEKLMSEKLSERDYATAEAEFKRAILELRVAGRRRKHITS